MIDWFVVNAFSYVYRGRIWIKSKGDTKHFWGKLLSVNKIEMELKKSSNIKGNKRKLLWQVYAKYGNNRSPSEWRRNTITSSSWLRLSSFCFAIFSSIWLDNSFIKSLYIFTKTGTVVHCVGPKIWNKIQSNLSQWSPAHNGHFRALLVHFTIYFNSI